MPMFGIGFPELIVILVVALLVVGPSKLPELAKSMGRALGEFRRMADDVKETLEEEAFKEEQKAEDPGQTEVEQAAEQYAGTGTEAPSQEPPPAPEGLESLAEQKGTEEAEAMYAEARSGEEPSGEDLHLSPENKLEDAGPPSATHEAKKT